MSDATLSTLSNIRTKIRRLTRNPSTSQLSNADLDNYINNFILYDMPAHIKLDTLKTVLTFYTTPYVEKYSTSADISNPLYNFKNKYTNVQAPVYIAGEKATFSQSRNEFYDNYPATQIKLSIGTGNGVTTNFTGTLSNVPILQNYVSATSIDTNGDRLLVTDDGAGNLEGDTGATSTIIYLTGVYDITFSVAPADGETIWLNTLPYTPNKPNAILYVENEFTVMPVPDSTYRIDVIALQRPTEMAETDDMPELSEWWQFVSYGAAIKVLQDRLDMDTVQLLLPEFNNQETLINRRKIVQNASKRVATIFTSSYNNDLKGDF